MFLHACVHMGMRVSTIAGLYHPIQCNKDTSIVQKILGKPTLSNSPKPEKVRQFLVNCTFKLYDILPLGSLEYSTKCCL